MLKVTESKEGLDELVDVLELIDDIDVEKIGRWGVSLKTKEECLLDLAVGKNDEDAEDTDDWCTKPLAARVVTEEALEAAVTVLVVVVVVIEAIEDLGEVGGLVELEVLVVEDEDRCRGGRDDAMIVGWRGECVRPRR